MTERKNFTVSFFQAQFFAPILFYRLYFLLCHCLKKPFAIRPVFLFWHPIFLDEKYSSVYLMDISLVFLCYTRISSRRFICRKKYFQNNRYRYFKITIGHYKEN